MIDEHIGCPSYPVCEDAPLGCVVQQGVGNVEWYGHKDNDDENKKMRNLRTIIFHRASRRDLCYVSESAVPVLKNSFFYSICD